MLSRIYKEQGFQGDNYHSRISQESMEEVGGSNNHLNGLYPDNLGEPAPELTETLTQYTTLTVFKFLMGTPKLLSQAS